MALTSAVSDFIKSIYELFASVFGTAYSLAHSLFMAIFNFVGGLLTLAGDIASGVLDIAGGVSKFVLGNFVLVVVGAVAAIAFVRYTAQGRQVAAAGKKTN
ncbi:hypothetical protein ACRE_037680 [Hapsidospora chrysogenum ATCC 11550]|uniref:Uncharacterized protein n=1 Tax=Hapsidospora chrysogenum (strain ATCC 11550 / CBS 779.69 / DSM 880 / IAM 14645 / JCM 23072 / IMI 49137) TaxID=857340 RepID=A0A086T7X7_HAPC1|nr:hypothetical protein ACRE_037680 [Hapsidospora chrysogenum ATCC 11550]